MNPINEKEALERAEFDAAFGETAAPDNPDLGVEMPADATAAAEPEMEAAEDAGQTVDSTEAPQGAPEADTEVPPVAAAVAPEPDDGKNEQREKSWEGRLKKMEAELLAQKKINADAVAQKLEKAGELAQASGNDDLGTAAQEVADQVEDGTMTAAQAMKQLSDDFGEEFVKLIETVVSAKAAEVGKKAAKESVGEVDSKVKDIISHITDANERSHFERIAEAHEDFDDVRQSKEFAEFVSAGGAARQSVADGGAAKDVIKLLTAFKAQAVKPAPTPPPAAKEKPKPVSAASADAAAGVRSGSVSLPAEPADKDDFEAAWQEAASRT